MGNESQPATEPGAPKTRVPTAFISSTSEDLPEYRLAAREAVLSAGFYPSMMEYFTASGARPPLAACLEKVDAADVVLVIVAHRYGWIPPKQSGTDPKSVTWLECERALAGGKEVIPFLVDAEAGWPDDRTEEFRLVAAVREGKRAAGLFDEVQQARARLADFKTWLNGQTIRASFRTPDDLGRQIAGALYQWRFRHPDFERAEAPRVDDRSALAAYRRELVKASQYLPLRGIDIQSADPTSAASRLDLAKVYVTLNTTTRARSKGGREQLFDRENSRPLTALEAMARHKQVVILGGPGSGKSTLLSHLTFCLSAHQLEPELDWLSQLRGWPSEDAAVVPVVVALRDFARTVEGRAAQDGDRADLLWTFIEGRLEAQNVRGAAEPIKEAIGDGRGLVLLDGLDEIPTRPQRLLVRDAVQAFCRRYEKSRYIVTCRTLSYQDAKVRLEGFPTFELAPWDDEQVSAFIGAWYDELLRLRQIDEHASATSRERLREAARRGDLIELARNPMLLTVMALVNTHKGRLPDARALLYEEIVDILLVRWESRRGDEQAGLSARLRDAGRSESDLKRVLWRLAFETHRHGGAAGHEGPADIDEGSLLRALIVLHPAESRDWAWQLVELMKVRAGLLLERAPGVFTFPHRTFQEYLAGAQLSVQENFVERCTRDLAADPALWRQAILLAVGRLVHVAGAVERPLFLASELCPPTFDPATTDEAACRRAWLAGEVLDEVGSGRLGGSSTGAEISQRIPLALARLVERGVLSPVERCALGDTLGRLGDPRFDAKRWYLPAGGTLGFVTVDAAPFLMGSGPKDAGADADEKPQHSVEVPTFYIGHFPVTVAQFGAYLVAGGADIEQPDRFQGVPNHPVVNVSWYEALGYCRWLTEVLRGLRDAPADLARWLDTTVRTGWEVTLPNEAEWEKAARDAKGLFYPWSDQFSAENANTIEAGIGRTSAVGAFPGGRSSFGAFDMSGNVWEWTASLLKPYPYRADDGREELRGDGRRVVRGGSFGDSDLYARAAHRSRARPGLRDDHLGFRVVVSRSRS